MGRYLAMAILAVCALAWLTVAALFATEAGTWTFDGYCYEPRPVWAVGQAVVAVAGIGFLVRGAFVPRRARPEVLGLAAVSLFAVWLVLILAFATDVERILCPGQSPRTVAT